ncbi:MAG: hypothetical protein ACI89X_003314 [Planctomycetota bacterium]|jgi:hypothetical protein
MNEDPNQSSNIASPVFVEDLFLTDVFLIKGRLANKTKRLSNVLEDNQRSYLQVVDATLVSLRNNEVIKTPNVMVSVKELILAHELVDCAGDDTMRRLAGSNDKHNRIRAFYNGSVQFEVGGQIEAGAYESNKVTGRKYFIMQGPSVRGLDLDHQELKVLKSLDYAILKKDRMAYVYDFG